MSTLKLYTEEQVKQIIANYNTERFVSTNELLEDLKLKPIDLPSDEEINEQSKKWILGSQVWEKGAKWMKEQILNQNK